MPRQSAGGRAGPEMDSAAVRRSGMNLAHVGHYFRDAAVPRWRKLLGLFAVAYAVMPVDLIPDVLPVVGWLDDVGVLAAITTFLVQDIRRHALRLSAAPVIDAEVRAR